MRKASTVSSPSLKPPTTRIRAQSAPTLSRHLSSTDSLLHSSSPMTSRGSSSSPPLSTRIKSSGHLRITLNNSRGPVMIIPFIMVASYKTMHESVCRLAQDKLIPLIIVSLPLQSMVQRRKQPRCHLTPIQHQYPIICSMYRGNSCRQGYFMRNELVPLLLPCGGIFIGGPDDREALPYATRMSNQQSEVAVTVVRIVLQKKKECTTKNRKWRRASMIQ